MNSTRIVIVDDDEAILDSLSTILDFEGFEVKTFIKGSDLFQFIDNSVKPHLILLDMWLCGEDGREICKQLKQNEITKSIPVVIMSASRGLQRTAIESGANAFIAKPFEVADIVHQLQHLTA